MSEVRRPTGYAARLKAPTTGETMTRILLALSLLLASPAWGQSSNDPFYHYYPCFSTDTLCQATLGTQQSPRTFSHGDTVLVDLWVQGTPIWAGYGESQCSLSAALSYKPSNLQYVSTATFLFPTAVNLTTKVTHSEPHPEASLPPGFNQVFVRTTRKYGTTDIYGPGAYPDEDVAFKYATVQFVAVSTGATTPGITLGTDFDDVRWGRSWVVNEEVCDHAIWRDKIESAPTMTVHAQCNDTVDNDSDGFTDYPADPNCIGSYGQMESCGLGFEAALMLLPLAWLRRMVGRA